jgi:hypothetical protein
LAKNLRNQNERASKFKPQTRERREKGELGDDGGRGGDNNASLRARSREGGEEQQAATSPTAQGKETEPNVQLSLFLLQIVKIEKDNRIKTTKHSVLFYQKSNTSNRPYPYYCPITGV